MYISPARATEIYERICDTQNIKRPRLSHYIQDYCSGAIGASFLATIEHAKLDVAKGLTTHSTQWAEKFIAEREQEWKIIRKKRYRG
jgi:hypothetical protein